MRAANSNQRVATGLDSRGQPEPDLHPLASAMQENWTRLNDRDLSGVKNRADLAAVIRSRYRLSDDEAESQVEAWSKERGF